MSGFADLVLFSFLLGYDAPSFLESHYQTTSTLLRPSLVFSFIYHLVSVGSRTRSALLTPHSTLYTALIAPRFSAVSCSIYVLGRILYTLGYVTGEPKKRNRGQVGYIGIIGADPSKEYSMYLS